jgi:hypothetical protein
MPPKKNQDPPTITNEQIEEILANQKSIIERLDTVEQLLSAARTENASLKSANSELSKELADKSTIINNMLHKQNNLEQYNRSWSIRLAGISIPPEDSTNPVIVMRHVYDNALLPILKGALSRGLLQNIPPCEQLLETAHILPGKNDNKPRPIIARFYSRNMRAMMFQLKKEFAHKATSSNSNTSNSQSRSPRLSFPFYEDLTSTNFKLLKALADDPRTGAVWSIGGVIRYKMADGTVVKKVQDVFDSIDNILR